MLPLDFFIFLQIILFLFITPGLPRIVIVSHTINYGLNRSVWTALGDISANICQGILVVFIIGSFLRENIEALNLIKWAGILYILYLAYDTYTARLGSIKAKDKVKPVLPWITFWLPAGVAPVKGLAPDVIKSWGKPGPVTESPVAIPETLPETL